MKWALVGASTIADQWMVNAIRAAGDDIVAIVSGDLTQLFLHQRGPMNGQSD